ATHERGRASSRNVQTRRFSAAGSCHCRPTNCSYQRGGCLSIVPLCRLSHRSLLLCLAYVRGWLCLAYQTVAYGTVVTLAAGGVTLCCWGLRQYATTQIRVHVHAI
ncbi:unnamed protein product, partial [Ectocarpus sp. 4 AP-2014]